MKLLVENVSFQPAFLLLLKIFVAEEVKGSQASLRDEGECFLAIPQCEDLSAVIHKVT